MQLSPNRDAEYRKVRTIQVHVVFRIRIDPGFFADTDPDFENPDADPDFENPDADPDFENPDPDLDFENPDPDPDFENPDPDPFVLCFNFLNFTSI